MNMDTTSFAFIISLAAVINGLGIVQLLLSLGEYLRTRHRLRITHYWVFNLVVAFQFLLHILLWWSLWNAREAAEFNFLTYLYLLFGPILLFLGTSLLLPDVEEHAIDVRVQYFHIRRSYFTAMGLLWLWAIFFWPVLSGVFGPTAPILTAYLVIAVVLRLTAHPRVHEVLALANWVLLVAFIVLYAMQLGAVGRTVTGG